MKQKHSLFNRNAVVLTSSVIASFLFVAIISYAATTISTNVNTGGTLTVTGASTLTGAVWATSTLQVTGATTLYNDLNVDSGTLFIDSTNNRLGIGSTTPAIELSVEGDGYLTGGLGLGQRNAVDKTLVLSGLASDPTGAAGMVYYNSSSGKVLLYNGSSWGVVGTSSGLDLIGNDIRMVSPSVNYFTLGTTTAQGASLATLEATSTVAIPLSLVAYTSQAANTFQVKDSASANLLYINSGGGLFGSSTGQFTGSLTTYGSDILGDAAADTLTIKAGIVAMVNSATTTILASAVPNLWSIATSSTNVPILTVSGVSSLYGRVGVATTSPGYTFSVTGDSYSTGNFIVDGNATLGNAAADTATINAGTVAMTNSATTTILASAVPNLWSIATSSTNVPILSVSGVSSPRGRVGVGTAAPNTTLETVGTASSTNLIVGGDGTNGNIGGIVFGYCTTANTAIAATSTVGVQCASATGIRVGDRVFVSATSSLPTSLAVTSASSTAANTIGLYIANLNGGVSVNTGNISLNFFGIR